jgi:hypothetical protein
MKIVNYILSFIFFTMLIVQAQENDDLRRQREHQAVKNYMKMMKKNSTTERSAETEKSELKDNSNFFSQLLKPTAQEDRKYFFMNGNKISTNVYNYGGIAPGYGLLRNVNNIVWRDLGYVFQFCPIVGAEVVNTRGSKIHIISDGLWDYPAYREVSPDGRTLWQWQPLPGYADPDQQYMASNPAEDVDGDGKPDSWPRDWYNPTLGRYVWPGYLSQDVTNADLEVFWAMDDRENVEFEYYPFVNDSSRKGIGLQVDGRAFQWSNALAENTIFFVYTITNVSDKDIDSLFFGIYGDPDLGGGSPENSDDNGFFIPPYADDGSVDDIPVYARSMVYFWDPDMTGNYGLPLGYVACKFLESPGNPDDGIDNDGDGMIDERQDDGIDNDNDWSDITDDVGVDGIPKTNDFGEGDLAPTPGLKLADGSLDPLNPGEPNYELTDLDEADQIGLTSFNSWRWSDDGIQNDESMWNRCIPRNFGDISQSQDIVFIFGSGYISLRKGETKRISMALLMGEDLDDILTTAETVQTIYNQNYKFFKPPITPKVTAVPGDKKVTLYWDSQAEESIDPLTGKDFEGYVIYRSTDPSFNDIQTISDGRGSAFLSEPLKTVDGFEAKFDVDEYPEPFVDENQNGVYDSGEPFSDVNKDGVWSELVEDPWLGYHPVPYRGRGIQYYLGNNSGLVHSFVDSNDVVNGQTYYYAVVAYDHGDSLKIPPTETTKKISVDPITSELKFDDNTVMVVPGPRSSGYTPPEINSENIMHEEGVGTGDVTFEILDDLAIREGGSYKVTFSDSVTIGNKKAAVFNYSALDENPVTYAVTFYDLNFAALGHKNISDDSFFKVMDNSGTVYEEEMDYIVNYRLGTIRRSDNSTIPNNSECQITYRHYPFTESTYLSGEDGNLAFDGIKLKVYNDDRIEFDPDPAISRWVEGNTNMKFAVARSPLNLTTRYPADYEVSFSEEIIDSALAVTTGLVTIGVNYSVKDVTSGVPMRVPTFLNENFETKNEAWDPGEPIIFFTTGSEGGITDTTTWELTITAPSDTSITPILPTDGDVLFIRIKRPFTSEDVFVLSTEAGKVNTEQAKSQLDNIYVVPNPYIGYSVIEPTNRLPGTTRGERRVYFENLPQKCTIRIFTLSGTPVKTIEHNNSMESGREYWNLLNQDGFSVAYGVYIAHIDAPGIGEKLIKFALIK